MIPSSVSMYNDQAYLCIDTDCGVFNWPWQCFGLGKGDCPLFVSSSRSIPVQQIHLAEVLSCFVHVR